VFALGCATALIAMLLAFELRTSREVIEVAAQFTRQDSYPQVVFRVWVTNTSPFPINLRDPALYFQSEGGTDSLTWSHWDGAFPLAPSDPLLPHSIASLSVSADRLQKQARLHFEYTYQTGTLRNIAGSIVRPFIQILPLKPGYQGLSRSFNFLTWLADSGLLTGRIRAVYEGPCVQWNTNDIPPSVR